MYHIDVVLSSPSCCNQFLPVFCGLLVVQGPNPPILLLPCFHQCNRLLLCQTEQFLTDRFACFHWINGQAVWRDALPFLCCRCRCRTAAAAATAAGASCGCNGPACPCHCPVPCPRTQFPKGIRWKQRCAGQKLASPRQLFTRHTERGRPERLARGRGPNASGGEFKRCARDNRVPVPQR